MMSAVSMESYQVVHEIAPALYGSVLLCIDKTSGKRVAIKKMHMELAQQRKSLAGPMVQEDVRVEKRIYRLMHKYGGHQNILKLYESFEQHGHEHFVLEYCSSGDLFTLLRNSPHQRFTAPRSLTYFKQICNGLNFLHNNGIAHGDISLENILVNDSDVCKLMDFGLSVDSSQEVKPKSAVGKFFYMPPEMYLGASYDPFKADMWSLGILLVIMHTGMPPFGHANASDKVYLSFEIYGIRALLHGWNVSQYFTKEALDLVEKLLVVDPDKRLSMAGVLRHPYFPPVLSFFREKKAPGNVQKFFQRVFRRASFQRDPSECTVDMDNQEC